MFLPRKRGKKNTKLKRSWKRARTYYKIKKDKGELFETVSQANKRVRKMLPEHIKEHLWTYGTINYGSIRRDN